MDGAFNVLLQARGIEPLVLLLSEGNTDAKESAQPPRCRQPPHSRRMAITRPATYLLADGHSPDLP